MSTKDDAFLAIDLNNLDRDCAGQPRLVRLWGQQLAEARRNTAERKNAVKLVYSELRNAIRSNPTVYGLEKATVDAINDLAEVAQSYQDALQMYVQAEYEEDSIKAVVMALNGRGEQLSNEVKLYGQMYWSKVSGADPDTRERYNRDREAANYAAAQAAQSSKPKKK